MRVFVAIELSDVLKDDLIGVQNLLVSRFPVGKYFIRDNFHLTIKFIGEVGEDAIGGITDCIDSIARASKEFTIVTGKLGHFPKGNRAVAWLGVRKSLGLESLYRSIDRCLVDSGYVRSDRKFAPHITMGRNVLISCGHSGSINMVDVPVFSYLVKGLCLMESRRVDGVLRYIPIYRCKFGV